MVRGPEGDALHLDRILDVVRLARSRLAGTGLEAFRGNRDLIDATALRLAAIGESSRRLSDQLKGRHPKIPWEQVYRLRNIVAHHYDRIDADIIWVTATERLDELEAVCRAELDRLGG